MLDLWILAVLLHPYYTHPIWEIARQQLRRLGEVEPGLMLSYLAELDDRLREGENIFGSLADMYVETFYPPSTYVRSILPF